MPDKLLELDVTDDVILSMLDEDVPYGVPVILESSGLSAELEPGTRVEEVVLKTVICSSNYLMVVFLVLN